MTRCKCHLAELHDAAHGAPVELHAAADAVDARAQHHDVGMLVGQVVLSAVVGQVQVVGLGRPLRRHRVDLLDHGQDSPVVPQLSHGQFSAAGRQMETTGRGGRDGGTGRMDAC